MNCQLDVTLLQDLLEGVIDPVEKIFVEEHLKTCKQCRKELAELKLLFWDLNDKANYDISMPQELDRIKYTLLEEFAPIPTKKTAEIILDVHRNNTKSIGMFLDYIPGVKASNKLVKKGVRTAPTALGKVSKALVKSTRFLLAE
ncbi:MAG: hypothetical protein APF84_00180 [Gracilibacter sp. BRH_c7a]|nr:MAG: hypothetical protein APF84_00180 [Gracilibacter sp. BRH_c7a]